MSSTTDADAASKLVAKVSEQSAFVKQYVPALVSAVHAHPTDAEIGVRATLEMMHAGDGTPSVLFMELCEYVKDVFPDDVPTDSQVFSSAATPDLTRYLIRALKLVYQRHAINGGKSKGLGLESAMLYRRSRGGSHSGAVQHYEEICREGRRAKKEVTESGGNLQAQLNAAVKAGYRKFRELTEPAVGRLDQKHSEKAATEMQVIEAFKREGVFEIAVLEQAQASRRSKG